MNKRRLVELCDVIVPMRDKPKEFVTEENGIPWCRIEDIEGKFLNGSKSEKYVSKECIERMNLKVFPVGTVLCAVTGASIGTYAITTRELITNQTFAGLVCKENLLYNEFLYYYIKMHTSTFINNSVGCAQAYITRETLENFLIPDLEYDEQVRLVKVLKHLDDKIKINNESNVELELMTRTIYDYWFLQFDFPDESGKPYKSSGGKMVWNEELKREIPEGWKVKRIKDCVKHINTGLNPRDNFVLGQGDIKYVTVKNLMSNGTLDFASCDTIDSRAKKIIHKRSDVAKGDILFASIAPLGRCFIVQEEPEKWDINESVFSIRPNIDMVSKEYLYLFFISQAFVRLAEFSSTGSVFYGIRISTLENMQIIIPDEDTMQKFTNYTSDILYKKYLNFIGNHELASLRDFLLPLLMNGQVGFKEC